MSLAIRRHHAKRMKDKFRVRQAIHKLWGDSNKAAGTYANHGCSCSCVMCGNPRRYFGELTIQERKAIGGGSGD